MHAGNRCRRRPAATATTATTATAATSCSSLDSDDEFSSINAGTAATAAAGDEWEWVLPPDCFAGAVRLQGEGTAALQLAHVAVLKGGALCAHAITTGSPQQHDSRVIHACLWYSVQLRAAVLLCRHCASCFACSADSALSVYMPVTSVRVLMLTAECAAACVRILYVLLLQEAAGQPETQLASSAG
jgi:hypothetical protein